MRIAFLLHSPDAAAKPVTARTVDVLRGRGIRVECLVAGDPPVDLGALRPRHDLYVLKSNASLAESLAGALEIAGAEVVNTPRSSLLSRDKIAGTSILAAAGLPVPPSWATGRAADLTSFLEEDALWLKPQFGKAGRGVRRVVDAAELGGDERDALGFPLLVFAQREVPSQGEDFKVYVIGQCLWAVVRRWPTRSPADKLGRRVPLPADLGDLALRAGRALGLEVFGVDFLLAGDQRWIVDVNPFPGFNGLDEAPEALADYLVERASSGAAWSGQPACVEALA